MPEVKRNYTGVITMKVRTLEEVMKKYPEGKRISFKNKYHATVIGYSMRTIEPEVIIRWENDGSTIKPCGQFSIRAKGFKVV